MALATELKLDIESMSHGPYGLAKLEDGQVVFLENTCPGDEVLAHIYDERKGFSFAHTSAFRKQSEDRNLNPPCKLHKICGGCQWQHVNYDKQLEFKRRNIIDLLVKEKILDESWRENYEQDLDLIAPAIGMEEPWNYRNKIVYPVRTVPSSGRLKAGYFQHKSNELVNIKSCPIQYSVFDKIMEFIKNKCAQLEIGSPLLRHIQLRANLEQDQVLITFIVRKKELARGKKKLDLQRLAKILKANFKSIRGVALNYNDMSTNTILGQETEVLVGQGYIMDSIDGIRYRLSPTSFFQVNNSQAKALIDSVLGFIDIDSCTGNAVESADSSQERSQMRILDAYCGIGTFTLQIARRFPETMVHGMEIVESAIEDAKENARLNDISNIDFQLGKVEDLVEKYTETHDGQDSHSTIVANPPRKGCTSKVLEAFGKILPKQIIFVSCNPATLARDIKFMEKYGYGLKKLQPVDLFPHTFHVESVALLELAS